LLFDLNKISCQPFALFVKLHNNAFSLIMLPGLQQSKNESELWNSTNNSSILIIAHSGPTATSTPDRTQQRCDMLCTPLEHLSPSVLRARRVLPDLIRRYYSQAARQYSSVNHCWDTIEADIASELSNGFTAQVAFKPHKTNALGAVKKGDGKWRRFTVVCQPQ
jgi:hypothetical protein